ncbi:MAG: SDR family NAD(P)-dependent oxidoreductase [Pigmentiphaga sp.]
MGRLAVITGAGSGIGAACCGRLAREGYQVMAVDIDLVSAERTAAQLDGSGHRAVECDVTKSKAVHDMFADLAARTEHPEVLVTCAGGSPNTHERRPPLWEIPSDEWQQIIDLNLGGTFHCISAFLKSRCAAGLSGGRIVTLSSIAARMGQGVTGAAYSAAKAGILGLTRVAALEAASLGVSVNAVLPGPVDTPAFRRANDPAQYEAMLNRIPLRRVAMPDEIAAAVAYLVGDGSGIITGASIDINGGMVMH